MTKSLTNTSVKHFRVFSSKCYIKRNEDDLGKFDSRTNEGIFLGYSSTKKAYKCYNQRLHKIIESADERVDVLKSRRIKSQDEDEDLQKNDGIYDEEEKEEEKVEKEDSQEIEDEDSPRLDTKAPSRRIQKNNLETQIRGDKDVGVSTRRQLLFNEQALLSVVEPKNFAEASKNDDWI